MTVQPRLPEPKIDGDELLRLAIRAADATAALLGEIETHPGCLNDPGLCAKVRNQIGSTASQSVLALEELTTFMAGRVKFLHADLEALKVRAYSGRGAWRR